MDNSEEVHAPAPEPAAGAGESSPQPETTAAPASPPPPTDAPAKAPSPAAKAPSPAVAKAPSPVGAKALSLPPVQPKVSGGSAGASSYLSSTQSEKFDVYELPKSRHMYSHLTSSHAIAEQHRWNARSLVRKQEDLLHSLSRIRANLERMDLEFENALKLAAPPAPRESDPTGLRKVARATARERRELDRREGSREGRLSQSEEREAIACSDGGGVIETLSEPVDDGEKYACDEIGKLRSKIDNLLAKTSYEPDYTIGGGGGSVVDKLGGSYLPRYSSVPPLPRASYEVEYGLGGASWDLPAKNHYLSSYDPYAPVSNSCLDEFSPLAGNI